MSGIAWMLLADLAFACMAACTKFTGHRLPAFEVVFVRSAVSCFILWLYFVQKNKPLKANEPGLLWMRGLVGYIALQSYFWAIPRIPLGTAVMLNYTAPIFAVFLSMVFLRERPSRTVLLALAVAFLGVYLLSSPEISGNSLALLAALLSGLLAGAVHVMIRQSHKSDEPLLVIFYFTMACTLLSGAGLLKTGWVAPTGTEMLGLAGLTFFSFIGQVGLTYSLQRSPVWVVAPFGFLTPVLSLLLGVLFWMEIPAPAMLAGSALVILAGTFTLTSLGRRSV